MVLLSLGVHIAVFSNIVIALPDKTTRGLPAFYFIGSILTDQDLSPAQKQTSRAIHLHTLPKNLTKGSKQLTDERNILKPDYAPHLRAGNKIDYKPPLNAVNPKEKEREAERIKNTEKLLGIDLHAPPRPTLKLYKQ